MDSTVINSGITLKSSHLTIHSELVHKVFGEVDYAYVVYIEDQKTILTTPVTSQWFGKMHRPTQFLLKSRNLKGDKTLAIREILIDYDLDSTDRALSFEWIKKTKLIKIRL